MRTIAKSKGVKGQRKEFSAHEPEMESGSGESDPMLAGVSNEERHHLIAEGAYFRAEQRNFAPGCELDDWLAAEAEIERRLSGLHMNGMPRHS